MKNKKLRIGIHAMIVSGVFFFAVGCNNSDYTKNPPGNTPNDTATTNKPANDTAMTNTPARTDTASKMAMPEKKQMMSPKKHGKVTVGKMESKKSSAMKPDENGVYEMTEVLPSFPGGHAALQDYVNNNIEDQGSFNDNMQGTVDVQFIVDENGNVKDARVIGNKLENGLDDAAVKVVSNMPKWTPGKVKGKDVKTRVVLPITYKPEEQ